MTALHGIVARVLSWRRGPDALLLAAVLVIAVATLWPGGGTTETSWFCILCGAQREVADLVSNVLLFLPFGIAIAVRGGGVLPALLAGMLYSGLIEVAQVELVAGRDSSLRDLAGNSTGAFLGAVLWQARLWRFTRAAGVAGTGALALITTGVLLAGLVAFTPVVLEPRYRVQMTPGWDGHDQYDGTVLSVRVGPLEVAGDSGAWLDPGPQAELLLRTEPLHVRFIAGPPTRGLAPIASVHSRGVEFMLIAALGTDFVYRFWSLADEARLDHSNLQLAHTFGRFAPGDTLTLAFHLDRGGYCLQVNGEAECARGFTVGDTWTLLLSPDWRRLRMLFAGTVWLWAVFLPVGFVARDRRTLAMAAATAAAGILVGPVLLGFALTPVYQVAGVVAGVLTGYTLAGILGPARRPRPRQWSHRVDRVAGVPAGNT